MKMWIGKWLIICLFTFQAVMINNAKLNSFAYFKNKTSNAKYKTKSITVYNDKEATNKIYSFEGIILHLEKSEKYYKGIKIDLTGMTAEKENGENFFQKFGKKVRNGIYFIYFSSFYKCDIMQKIDGSLNLDLIHIGLIDKEEKTAYISIGLLDGEGSISKITKDLHNYCEEYSYELKIKLDIYYKIAKEYFHTKKEKETLREKVIIQEDKNKNEEINLEKANAEKNIKIEKLEKDKKQFENNINQKNKIENELGNSYRNLNNIKAEIAKSELELKKLQDDYDKINKESSTTKARFDEFQKQKDGKRKELELKNYLVEDKQKKIEEMLKTVEDLKKQISTLVEQINKSSGIILENDSNMSNNSIRINTEQDNIDNIKNNDSAKTFKNRDKFIDDLQKKFEELKEDLKNINNDIGITDKNIADSQSEMDKILNDPNQKNISKLEKMNDILQQIHEYLVKTKELYPLIPDIYWDNVWRFTNVFHSESLNYLKGLRPSVYGAYDNLYTKKHPEKTLNDIDFVASDTPIVSPSKFKKMKKKL